MYKPLRKRKMSSYTSSLRKIINDEVENKISALKKEDVDPPSKEQEGFTTFDYDYGPTLEAPEDYYSETSTMSKEEFEKEMGSDQVDLQNKRYTAEQWNKEAEEVSFDNLTPEQKTSLDNFYGEDIEKRKGTKILKKDGKFYLDQGDYHTDESGVTKPMEITDPAFNQAPDKSEPGVEERSEPTIGAVNLADVLGYGDDGRLQNMSANDQKFFNTKFSEDNEALNILSDQKFIKKSRKQYEKAMKGKKNKQPFGKWLMNQSHPELGGKIMNAARQWEGDQATDTDSSGETQDQRVIKGPSQTRRVSPGQEQSPETINQFNMNRNASSKGQSKMIKTFGKPMSFRNNKH